MEVNAEGVLVATADRQRKLLDFIPAMARIANIESKYLFQLDSSDINPGHWQTIARTIADCYEQFDGFVILLGSDTMAHTATALSFMIENLGKPIVLTDTHVPLTQIASDNHSNLLNAMRFACEDIAEVSIMFSNVLLRGNRTKKTHDFAIHSFTSPNLKPLGEVGIDLRIHSHSFKTHNKPIVLKTNIVKDIAVIKLFPGITNEHVLSMVPPRTKGIVIEGYGAGNIPLGNNGIQDAIENIVSQDVVVAIDTQCIYGGVEYSRYVGGAFAKKHGALSSHDMTSESAIIKLMWVLGQTEKRDKIKELYEKNIIGELTE